MDISIIHTCDSFKFISFQKVAKQISNSLIKNRKKIFTLWQKKNGKYNCSFLSIPPNKLVFPK